MALGRCHCGVFEYSVEGSLGDVRYCHCAKCRRGNGTAFTANVRIHRSQWSIKGPRDLVTEYEHKPVSSRPSARGAARRSMPSRATTRMTSE